MEAPTHPPITDSPWFWVLVFSLMALAALAAMSGKYGRRQAAIERQYQARERVAAGQKGDAAAHNPDRRAFAMPDDTLVPLWPLAVFMGAIALLAGAMLYRARQRPGPREREAPS